MPEQNHGAREALKQHDGIPCLNCFRVYNDWENFRKYLTGTTRVIPCKQCYQYSAVISTLSTFIFFLNYLQKQCACYRVPRS